MAKKDFYKALQPNLVPLKMDISNKTGCNVVFTLERCEMITNAVFQTIAELLAQGETVKVPTFGKFTSAYMNPTKISCHLGSLDGKEIDIDGYHRVTFKASDVLKDYLDNV